MSLSSKKVIFILLAFMLLFLIGFSKADVRENIADSTEKITSVIDETTQIATSSESRDEYLKNQFMLVMNRSDFGRKLIGVNTYLESHKGVFWYFLGMDYELSWKFLAVLVSWFFLILLLFDINKTISLTLLLSFSYYFFSKEFIGKKLGNLRKPFFRYMIYLIVFVILLVLISLVRIPLGIGTAINALFSSSENFFVRLIYFAVIVLVLYLLKYFHKAIKEFERTFIHDLEKKFLEERIDYIESKASKSGKKPEEISEVSAKENKVSTKEGDEDEEKKEALAEAKNDFEGLADE